jgi:hypothetical protein
VRIDNEVFDQELIKSPNNAVLISPLILSTVIPAVSIKNRRNSNSIVYM